jgi:protease IV
MLDYYLASAADRIVSHPLGGVTIPGVAAQPLFLKGTLEKLGLVFDARRHGKYKSAVEMFTMDSLSDPNREQISAYVDALYEELLAGIGAGRGKSRAEVESLVNRAYFNSEQAKAAGLLDTCVYDDQLDSLFKVAFKGLRRQTEKDFLDSRVASEDWRGKPAVAIIYAVGSIAGGDSRTDFLSGEPTMGARTMVSAIRAARKDKNVKAIVLRIDSPGGDGFASDLIWRELELARQKKPVIASMGAIAGSGGYYIACNATRVFADATTLTGSIGVFDAKIVTEGLYNKLGARRQVVKRGEHADAQSDFRALTQEEDSMMQEQIDYFYRQFVQKVADGRHLTFEKVDSVGQGRIWAGIDGKKVGIVDELGGFLDAVEYAKKAAKLKDCDFEFYPSPKSGMALKLEAAAEEQVRKILQ